MTFDDLVRPLPRDLHPGAWWIWALALAAAASRTINPFALILIVAVAWLVVVSRRSMGPWGKSFRYYLWFGLIIIVLRLVYRIIFGGEPAPDEFVVLRLPEIPLPEAARSIQLFGDVGIRSLLAALYDGLRLATIIICVGAANSLANPKRLLKAVPPALYEVGAALVVAISVFPQLAESIQRVYRARRLRGDPGKGVSWLRRMMVPVLEDALERSMVLAAGMDARGYGRTGSLTAQQRAITGILLLLGLFGLAVGTYGYLDQAAPRILAWPMLLGGLLLAAAGFWWAGRRVQRTRYRPDQWRAAEIITVLSGMGLLVVWEVVVRTQPQVMFPTLTEIPPMSLTLVAGVLIAAIPAFATPLPTPVTVTDPASGGDT